MKIKNGRMLFLTMLQIIMIMLFLPGAALAASVLLEWDPSTDADLAGYKVYCQSGSSPTDFSAEAGRKVIDVANTTTATLDGLDPANSYYFSVTAYNSAGLESVSSNVIGIPESAPPVVTINSPSHNQSVSGTVSISATASDNVAVVSVQFYLNGVLQTTDTAAPYLFTWDTSPLAGGVYTVSVRASDPAGNLGQSDIVVTVAGDTAPPTVYLSAPGNNASVSGSVTVTATAGDDFGVTRVEVYDNGVLAFASNQNPASFSWNTLLEANGSHTLSARAYDAAGNVGRSADTMVSVVNDSSAPAVAFLSPVNGSTIGGTVSVAAEATDNVGITKVEFYLDGTLRSTSTGAPFSFSWNTAAVANGAYTLSAKAYDAAGNVGQSASVTVTVFNDTAAPAVSIGAPANSSTLGGTVAVTASSSDNVGVIRVEFYLNGALQGTATSAPYSFSWNTASVANGAYTLSAKAYDAAGNVGQSANVAVTVFNDRTVPIISLGSPGNNSTVGGMLAVSAVSSDNVGVTRVEFFVDGTLKSTSTGAPYGFNWNTATVANGAYTLGAKAYDAAGNVGQAVNLAVNVLNDMTAPVVSIANNGTAGGVITVSANASDNVAVSKVEFFVNGVLRATSTSAPYGFNWNTATAANGAYTLGALAYDAAGNVGQAVNLTVNVMNDTVAPVVTIAGPAAVSTAGGTVILSASATDNVGVSKVEFYLNGVLAASSMSAPYSFTWNSAGLASGAYALSATAYDAAGNVGRSSVVTVTVSRPLPDRTAPSVTLISPTANYVYGNRVNIRCSATDNVAVSRMELYIDGSLKMSTASSSFNIDWSFTRGRHTIMVKAYDAARNVSSVSKRVNRFF